MCFHPEILIFIHIHIFLFRTRICINISSELSIFYFRKRSQKINTLKKNQFYKYLIYGNLSPVSSKHKERVLKVSKHSLH